MNCHFPSCHVNLVPQNVWVPELKAIRQAIGKPVTVEMLADHAVCRRHSAVLREQGIKVFSYTSTAEELHRRDEERANAAGFFKLYLPMKEALKASGNGPLRPRSEASKGSNKKKAPVPVPAMKKENVTPPAPSVPIPITADSP